MITKDIDIQRRVIEISGVSPKDYNVNDVLASMGFWIKGNKWVIAYTTDNNKMADEFIEQINSEVSVSLNTNEILHRLAIRLYGILERDLPADLSKLILKYEKLSIRVKKMKKLDRALFEFLDLADKEILRHINTIACKEHGIEDSKQVQEHYYQLTNYDI